MNKKRLNLSTKEMTASSKPKTIARSTVSVPTCSTPEPHSKADSQDSDSLGDSDAPSPVPLLCTQDGAYGDTDVVWNYYTPTSKDKHYNIKSTPNSRKHKKQIRNDLFLERQQPLKKKPWRDSQKRTQLFNDLMEINKNLPMFLNNNKVSQQNLSDDNISDSNLESPKGILDVSRSSFKCLRKNLLASKFKAEPEQALESDDSMNECLIKASQVIEENLLNSSPVAKTMRLGPALNLDNDTMDSILNKIKMDSPRNKFVANVVDDSFDNIVGDLNDSTLETLSQMPAKKTSRNIVKNSNVGNVDRSVKSVTSNWTVKELTAVDKRSPKSFSRHSSMPESPHLLGTNVPSTSGNVFARHNSMPFRNDGSPIKCTQDEIKRKHQQAKEKLLAKRLLPFTGSQASGLQLTQEANSQKIPDHSSKNNFLSQKPNNVCHTNQSFNSIAQQNCLGKSTNHLKVSETVESKHFRRAGFVPKMPTANKLSNHNDLKVVNVQMTDVDMKSIIEMKRQEALMRLKRKRALNTS